MSRKAAIDVGTNSVRLYVADVDPAGVLPVERDLIITRLGEGVDEARALGEVPLRRTVEAIAGYHRRALAAGAQRVRIAATSAVRDAANREVFVEAVRDATGLAPEVLTGEQEARLSFHGATDELSEGGPFLVLDVGGGSTEFVVGERTVDAWTSIDIGSVRLTERHVRTDPPKASELAAVTADADAAVRAAIGVVGSAAATLIGLAGTVTTVAAIALGLDGYDRDRIHHAVLRIDEVRRISELLASTPVQERRKLPAMPPGREDVIVAGAVILVRVMEGFGFAEMVVSEADILDGLVLRDTGDV
jgi:exopolyphosphatase / guanosine-5'-triphosphate,3'-diphosphate pyrophosphatase